MHFWIDKRSQCNINQCRANARLTLNRLKPLEYVRPPYQHHQNHQNSQNFLNFGLANSNKNNNSTNFCNTIYKPNKRNNIKTFNYINNNKIIIYNNYIKNNNNINKINKNINNYKIIYRNNLKENCYLNPNYFNRPKLKRCNRTTGPSIIDRSMINTAATGSAQSGYRISRHQNIQIDSRFGTDEQQPQGEVVQTQPHLRWQVLVIFTFFVVTIRFYVLGNRSEVLIYCISGLILVMALLIFSALNLQKKLTNTNNHYNTTSPRYNGIQHTRLINPNNRLNVVGTNNNTTNIQRSRYPYVQQLVLQNPPPRRSGISHEAQLLAEAVVLLPPSPTLILQDISEPGLHHSQNSISPPPYDMAILLPNKNKKIVETEIDSSEDETPPPSYATVTDTNNR